MENKLEYYSNSIDILNDDCLMHIFQFLPLTKRVNVERVCKRWQRVSKESWYNLHTFNLYSQNWIYQENICDKLRVGLEPAAEAVYAILQRGGRFVKNLGYFGFAEAFLAMGAQLGLLCPNVQMVKLSGVSSLTIRSLAENCTEIRKFSVRDSIHPCDDELSLLFLNNRKLRTFAYICESTTKGGKFLLDLPANSMRKLKILDTNISSKYLKKAIQELTNLRILKFDVCENFDNESINAISSIKSLEKIQTGFQVGAITSLEPLFELSNLKVIELSFCSCVNDAFLLKLSKTCHELLQVNISYCTVSDVGVRYITSLPKLEELCVNNLSITNKAFCQIPNLRKIECFFVET